MDFLPLAVEEVIDTVTNHPPNKYKDDPITLGYKINRIYTEYENLFKNPYKFLPMGVGHFSGAVCGFFGLWCIMGVLDAANYIQRKDKE